MTDPDYEKHKADTNEASHGRLLVARETADLATRFQAESDRVSEKAKQARVMRSQVASAASTPAPSEAASDADVL